MVVGSKKLPLLLVLSLLPLGACKRSSSSNPGVPFRFVHAALEAGPVDVYVRESGEKLLSGLLEERTSVALNTRRGTFTYDVRAAGAAASSAPLASLTSNLEGADRVTFVIAGDASSSDPADELRILEVDETFSADTFPLARLRILNASPDSTGLGIDINRDGNYEIEGLGRFEQTPPELNDFLPSETLIPFTAGDGTPATDLDDFTIPSLDDNTKYLFIAVGRSSATPSDLDMLHFLLVGEDRPPQSVRFDPRIYVLAASADASPLDVQIDGTTVSSGLNFGDLDGPFQVSPAVHQVDAFQGATLAGTLTSRDLAGGTTTLVIAAGSPNASPNDKVFRMIGQPVVGVDDPLNARVRATVAASDPTAGLDIGPLETATDLADPPLFSNLIFLDPSGSDTLGTAVLPGLDTYGVAPTGTTTASFDFDLNLVAGQRVLWIFGGSFTLQGGQDSFRVLEVTTNSFPWTITEVLPN